MTEYRADLNLNAPALAFQAKALRVLERTTLILNAIASTTEHTGMVPGVVMPSLPIQTERRPLEVVGPETASWVVGCAVRDWLEDLSLYLVEVKRCCALLAAFPSPSETRISDETFAALEAGALKFEKSSFPDKLKSLERDFGDIVDDSKALVHTLFKARNCIVHRLGVVSELDCADAQHLTVRWKAAEMFARNPGEPDALATSGILLQPGGELHVRSVDVERRFAPGDRVVLNAADLCGIWWTLSRFNVGTAAKVCNFATAKGFTLDA